MCAHRCTYTWLRTQVNSHVDSETHSHRPRKRCAQSPTEPCSATQAHLRGTQAHHAVYPSAVTCTRTCTETALAGSAQQLRSRLLEGAQGKASLAQGELRKWFWALAFTRVWSATGQGAEYLWTSVPPSTSPCVWAMSLASKSPSREGTGTGEWCMLRPTAERGAWDRGTLKQTLLSCCLFTYGETEV